jgi:hypothetical protein
VRRKDLRKSRDSLNERGREAQIATNSEESPHHSMTVKAVPTVLLLPRLAVSIEKNTFRVSIAYDPTLVCAIP